MKVFALELRKVEGEIWEANRRSAANWDFLPGILPINGETRVARK